MSRPFGLGCPPPLRRLFHHGSLRLTTNTTQQISAVAWPVACRSGQTTKHRGLGTADGTEFIEVSGQLLLKISINLEWAQAKQPPQAQCL